MPNQQKLCADCQNLRIVPVPNRPYPVCAAPEFGADPVTGDPNTSCDNERARALGRCGQDGKLFVQRDPLTWTAWVSRPGPLLAAGYTL